MKAVDLEGLREPIAREGHVLVRGAVLRPSIARLGSLADWDAFAASWSDLVPDTYMEEAHRCRRRRHATFALTRDGALERLAHQPHFQAAEYNALYGGLERWFEPVHPQIGGGASMTTILRFCGALFAPLSPEVARWHVEAHQFRIEARRGRPGQPTPEGVHRDGVDYVMVLLIRRHNIASGTTTIHAPGGETLGSFTLAEPFDAALLDDRRVHHGVTAVEALDPEQAAYRDVLVVTLRSTP